MRGSERPSAVTNQVDLDTFSLLLNQHLREALADLIIIHDVGFHIDVVFCREDRCIHGLVSRWPILQQHDLVAYAQWCANNGLFECKVSV